MVNFGLYVIFIVYHHFPETPPPRYTGNVCLVLTLSQNLHEGCNEMLNSKRQGEVL